MKVIHYFLVLFLIAGCSNSTSKKNSEVEDKFEIVYSTPNDYLIENREKLVEDYFKYFKTARERIGELNFSVVEQKTVEKGNLKVFGLKISALGLKGWSYAEKVLVISNSGQVLYENRFRQIEPRLKIPECGMPNLFLDSLYSVKPFDNELLKIELREYFKGCCGHSLQETKFTKFFKFPSLEYVDSVETLFWLPYKGTCIEIKPEEKRISTIDIEKNNIIVQTESFVGGELTGETERTIEY